MPIISIRWARNFDMEGSWKIYDIVTIFTITSRSQKVTQIYPADMFKHVREEGVA